VFADLHARDLRLTLEALIEPVWSSNRAFQVDRRPIQKLTKFQPAIAREIGCMTVERGKATEDGRSKS
jgi:hypothetical protein